MQGLDQEMPGSLFLSTLRLNRSVFGWSETVGNQTLHFPPTVTMARIDQAVMRVLEPMVRIRCRHSGLVIGPDFVDGPPCTRLKSIPGIPASVDFETRPRVSSGWACSIGLTCLSTQRQTT